MRTRLACLLLALAALPGCRSVSPLLFPIDVPDMGPTNYHFWELRNDMERDGYHCHWPVGADPWDEW